MCSSLYFINIEGAKPFKYGRGQHLVTSLSLPRNEIQHCSILARHHSWANKRVYYRNYAADTTMVSHLDSFHNSTTWLMLPSMHKKRLYLQVHLLLFEDPWRHLLPKYQPKRGGDLGWGKLFQFKCGIKNYLQMVNVWSQFNCNIDIIWNQAQVYISN